MGYYNYPTSICHPTTPLIIFLLLLLLLSTPTSSFPTPLPPPPPPIPPPLPPPPKSPPPPHNYTLKPSITIIIGLLTTTFSITFLLLLYAKHCRRSRTHYPPPRSIDRDNSGIDRTIIDSLPVFRFGSLTGQKDGLECAVCLSRFDPTEILRLLPKCKHAFHVECVDTWLDSHSTCPLCRNRVDPEDIFLIVGEDKDNPVIEEKEVTEVKDLSLNRISGRHSSAGENRTILTDTILSDTSPSLPVATSAAGNRRSLDSWRGKKKGSNWKKKRKEETAAVGHRKDGALMGAEEEEERRRRRRFEHRIVVGAERWSDVQPSDLLYLRSEMVVSDVRRLRLKRSRPSVLHEVNSRSVSEMTGLSRFGSNEVAGTVSRLLARLTEPKSGRNSSSSNV